MHPGVSSSILIKKNLIKSAILAPIVIFLIVMLNIYHYAPSFQLKRLYVPGLDKTLNSSTNSSIAFDIYFKGQVPTSNVYFDPINVTLYDGPNQNHSIAYFTIPEFFIEYTHDVEYSGMVNATRLDLDAARQEIATYGFKVFRLDLITSVRYDLYAFWKTGRHAYRKSVDVKIGDTGAAAKFGNNFVGMKVLVVLNIMVMVFLCSR